MKKIYFLLLILGSGAGLQAQTWKWEKLLNVSADYGISGIVVSPAGESYLRGLFMMNGTFEGTLLDSGTFLCKFDSSGNFIWARNFPGLNTMAFSPGGVLAIAGSFTGTFNMDLHTAVSSGSNDMYYAELSPAGNVTYLKTFGGSGDDRVLSLTYDSGGDIYLAGFYTGSISSGTSSCMDTLGIGNSLVLSMDHLHNLNWIKQGNWDDVRITDVSVDPMKNVYAFGIYTDTCYECRGGYFINRYDALGNVTYLKKEYASIGCFFDLEAKGSQSIYSQGYCSSTHSSDPFLTKYDANLNSQWVKYFGDHYHFNLGKGPAFDRNENIYTGGSIGSNYITNDTFMIGGQEVIRKGDNTDLLIAKMDSAGNYQWFETAYGPKEEFLEGMSSDAEGNLYLFGTIYNWDGPDTVAFGTHTLIASSNGYHHFIARLDTDHALAGITDNASKGVLSVFPNPSKGIVRLVLNDLSATRLCVYNLLGECIGEKDITNNKDPEIDLSAAPKGIYFLNVQNGKTVINKKVVLN
jgi:hypothetical protein